MVTMYDVVIIGSGVSGTASARELSRYEGKICVVEKEEDVCCGTSKANSAIIHAGYDAQEGSLMAKLNVRGNELMGKLSEDLDILFERIGSLVVCLSEEDMPGLKALYDRGIANGVKDLRILDRKEVHEMEPNLTAEVCAALYAPTAGIVSPFADMVKVWSIWHWQRMPVKMGWNLSLTQKSKGFEGWNMDGSF